MKLSHDNHNKLIDSLQYGYADEIKTFDRTIKRLAAVGKLRTIELEKIVIVHRNSQHDHIAIVSDPSEIKLREAYRILSKNAIVVDGKICIRISNTDTASLWVLAHINTRSKTYITTNEFINEFITEKISKGDEYQKSFGQLTLDDLESICKTFTPWKEHGVYSLVAPDAVFNSSLRTSNGEPLSHKVWFNIIAAYLLRDQVDIRVYANSNEYFEYVNRELLTLENLKATIAIELSKLKTSIDGLVSKLGDVKSPNDFSDYLTKLKANLTLDQLIQTIENLEV